MKEEYLIISDRYNYYHRFKQVSENIYRFEPEQKWMPIYINGKENDSFIDTEGGPCIGKGWTDGYIVVDDIIPLQSSILFKISEKTNNNQK